MGSEPYDVAIVGQGPGGIASALELHRNGVQRLILFELGNKPRKRFCPAEHRAACDGCRGVCSVIAGFGGAMHYGGPVKLSKFPSGRRLAELVGQKKAEEVSEEVVNLLFKGLDKPKFIIPSSLFGDFKLKSYQRRDGGSIDRNSIWSHNPTTGR